MNRHIFNINLQEIYLVNTWNFMKYESGLKIEIIEKALNQSQLEETDALTKIVTCMKLININWQLII